MKHGTLRTGVEDSINAAAESGVLDVKAHAAAVEMLRYMADFIDSAGGGDTPPTRYVTPASFLSYCERLGLLPDPDARKASEPGEDEPKGGIDRMRGKFGGLRLDETA